MLLRPKICRISVMNCLFPESSFSRVRCEGKASRSFEHVEGPEISIEHVERPEISTNPIEQKLRISSKGT